MVDIRQTSRMVRTPDGQIDMIVGWIRNACKEANTAEPSGNEAKSTDKPKEAEQSD